MSLNQLNAISPVDGRYRRLTEVFSPYFSEWALFKYRTRVEVIYFLSLCEIPLPQLEDFPMERADEVKAIYEQFTEEDADRIKAIEKTTNHDVKAVEYFLKEKFDVLGLQEWKEFIHFGLTSQDINNTAVPLSLKEATTEVLLPALENIKNILDRMAADWADVSMLARTHGQPASPTRMGKEIAVFSSRLDTQITQLKHTVWAAKFGGATGNFNAHFIAYPDVDWLGFADEVVNYKLGLHRSHPTTQIEHYDHLAGLFDNLKRINTILIDFSRDVWTYVSLDYFKQRIKEGEVGSSAMPHKVNPIDFENAEGNLGIANALFEHLAAKLPVSRLQRDLTDSTVLRNVGVPYAHTLIALRSIEKGTGKLLLNEEKIAADLNANWAVVAEAIQTVLRREGIENPYEQLKALTRTNEVIDKNAIHGFIDSLPVSGQLKAELKEITPFNYTGL